MQKNFEVAFEQYIIHCNQVFLKLYHQDYLRIFYLQTLFC